MDNKQILGLGLVAAAGVGAFYLFKNKEKKQPETNTTVKPTMQSNSLPVVEDRQKLYDEVHQALLEFFEIYKIRHGKLIKEMQDSISYGKITYGNFAASKSYKSLDDEIRALQYRAASNLTAKIRSFYYNNPIVAADMVFDFEKSTLDKMSVDEIKLYIEYLKLGTKKDERDINEFFKDPIKLNKIEKLKERYDWYEGHKDGLMFNLD